MEEFIRIAASFAKAYLVCSLLGLIIVLFFIAAVVASIFKD